MTEYINLKYETSLGKLKICLVREMPQDLGPEATVNQLRRQLYWTKETIKDLEESLVIVGETDDKIKEKIERLPALVREEKMAQYSKWVKEVAVRNILEAANTHLSNWKQHRVKLAKRLDIPIDLEESTNESQTSNRIETKRLQRPQVQLRRFDGNIENWCSFWETYRVLIHEDNSLSHVEKFNILESILDNEAKELLGGLQMTSDGYNTAIDLLLAKFGSEKKLIRSLNHELLNLPNSESFEEDEKLYLRIEKLCRQLKSLNQNIDDAPYFMTLEGKMSTKVLGKYFNIKDAEDNDNWNTAKFRNALGRAITQVRNKVEVKQKSNSVLRDKKEEPTMNFAVNYSKKNTIRRFSPDRAERFRGRKERTNRRQVVGQSSSNSGSQSPIEERIKINLKKFVPPLGKEPRYPQRESSSSESRSPTKYPCQFCDRPHTPVECCSVRTAEDRRDRASELSLCFMCLKTGHVASNCYAQKRRCLFCGRANHHSALCEYKFGKVKEIQEQNKGVSATTTQKEIVAASQCVERNYYDRPLEVSGDQLKKYGVKTEKLSQKIFKGGGIYDETNTSAELNVPISKKSINLNKVLSNQKSEDFKRKVRVKTQEVTNRKPLVATSPIVIIGDKRALELRKIFKEENLRGMVFEPMSWDAKLFDREIQLSKSVDTLVVWKQNTDNGLFEVLRKANEFKHQLRRIVWIKPVDGIEIHWLYNVTSYKEPKDLRSILIKLSTMGTPLIPVRNRMLVSKSGREVLKMEPNSSYGSNRHKDRFREFYPRKNVANLDNGPYSEFGFSAINGGMNHRTRQQLPKIKKWPTRTCAHMIRAQRTNGGILEPTSLKVGGCRSSTFLIKY
uniref:CCHC-type domain-containing protein n=1 Tax=Meloidogyne enterolobii TaxID=390850 RepID=A0A6V7U875_MELEN|nr:unnamed protein product [Meloidogyne enterolobii]